MDCFSEEPGCGGASFSQLSESRQSGAEHNVIEGGDQVAWLNADRGRIAAPGRTQPIFADDSVTLRVHEKYAEPTLTKLNAGIYFTQSAKDQMVIARRQEVCNAQVPAIPLPF